MLWSECYSFNNGALTRIVWPDGGTTLEQPAITVDMFRLIRDETVKEVEAKAISGNAGQ